MSTDHKNTAEKSMSVEQSASQSVWVVMPAYNEAVRIGETLRQVVSTKWNVVVVDDGSADQTATLASRFPVWVLKHPINCGQGAAIKTGLDFAITKGADIVVTFDADGQHAADEIEQLIAPIQNEETEVTLGSRFLGQAKGIPWFRFLILKMAILFTRFTTGLQLTDSHNGFRAFSRNAATKLNLQQARMAHASEILEEIARLKLTYKEVPVTVTYLEETLAKGQSSLGAFQITGHLLAGRIWK